MKSKGDEFEKPVRHLQETNELSFDDDRQKEEESEESQ